MTQGIDRSLMIGTQSWQPYMLSLYVVLPQHNTLEVETGSAMHQKVN